MCGRESRGLDEVLFGIGRARYKIFRVLGPVQPKSNPRTAKGPTVQRKINRDRVSHTP